MSTTENSMLHEILSTKLKDETPKTRELTEKIVCWKSSIESVDISNAAPGRKNRIRLRVAGAGGQVQVEHLRIWDIHNNDTN